VQHHIILIVNYITENVLDVQRHSLSSAHTLLGCKEAYIDITIGVFVSLGRYIYKHIQIVNLNDGESSDPRSQLIFLPDCSLNMSNSLYVKFIMHGLC